MCHKQSRPKAENKFTLASITIILSEPTHPKPRERTHPEEHPSCLPTKVRALPASSSAPFWEIFETNIFIQSAWADDYRCLYTVMQSETSPTHPPRSLSSYPSCIPPIKRKVSPPARLSPTHARRWLAQRPSPNCSRLARIEDSKEPVEEERERKTEMSGRWTKADDRL